MAIHLHPKRYRRRPISFSRDSGIVDVNVYNKAYNECQRIVNDDG